MQSHIELLADFDNVKIWEPIPGLIYFSKKSPFKDTPNEDALGLYKVDDSIVLAVADGAGGHPKGEEAASTALKNLQEFLQKADSTNLRSAIVNSIEETNRQLLENGIGSRTTLTVCEISNNKARGYQVGDSTLIICGQKGKLKFRSISHSPVGYGIEAGLIDEDEALNHPELHYISNLVGEAEMKIELGPEIDLATFDSVFLSSDGLFDNFSPQEIADIVRKGSLGETSADLMKLIKTKIYANEEAKKDDICFVLFRNS